MPNKKKEDSIELLPAGGKQTKLYSEENGNYTKLYSEENGNYTKLYSEENGEHTKLYNEENGEHTKLYSEENGEVTKLYDEENGELTKLCNEENGELTKLYNEEDGQKPQYQLEDIIQSMGGCGRYQIRLTLLIKMMQLPSAWFFFDVIFTNIIPRWTCADDLVGDTNITVQGSNITWNENCTNKHGSKCSKFLFETSQYNTFINEWSLVCDRDWIPYTIASLQLVGVFLGNMLAGILSDGIGRKKPLYISILIHTVGNGLAFLCTSWIEMAVIKFFLGVATGIYLAVNDIIISEVTLSRWRALSFAIPSWAIHESLFTVTAWLVPDWAYLGLITMLITIPCFATWCFVMESIRWLMVKDELEEADAVIHEIASVNKHPYPGAHMVLAVTDRIKPISETADKKEDISLLEIFKSKYLLKITGCLLIDWTAAGIGMYGLEFAISNMHGNKYLTMLLFSLLSAMSQTVAGLVCHRFGRKTSIALFFTTATLCCLGATITRLPVVVEYTSYIYIAFAAVAHSSVLAVWSVLIVITMELYPTVIRNRAFGFVNMASRFCGVISPQLALFEIWIPGMLYFVCGGFCLLATIAAVALPETKDVALKDQLHDETQAEFTHTDTCYTTE